MLLALVLAGSLQEKPRLVELRGDVSGTEPARPAALDAKAFDLSLRSASLADALAAVEKGSGFAVRADASIGAANAEPLTLAVRGIRASAALALLAELYGFDVRYDEEAAHVTVHPDGPELRVHNVSDVTYALQDFPPEEDEGGAVQFTTEQLVELVVCSIDPDGWDQPDRSIQGHEGTLIIRATPAVHDDVRRLIDEIRAVAIKQVRTEIEVVAVDESLMPALRKGDMSALAAAREAGKAERIASTEIVGFDTQRVAPTRLTEEADRLIADVRPVCSPDLGLVTTELRLTLRRGRDEDSSRTMRLLTMVTAPAGETVVVGSLGFVTGQEPRRAVVLMRSTPDAPYGGARPEPEKPSETRRALDGVRMRFEGRPVLGRALAQISGAGGIDVVFDPRLAQLTEGAGALPAEERTAAELLDAVAAAHGLVWEAREGFVWVTRPPARDEPAHPVRIYPVSDLLYRTESFPGPRMDLVRPDSGYSGAAVQLDDDNDGAITQDYLTVLIPQSTGGVSWEADPLAYISLVNNMLVISQSPAVHDEVADLLGRLRSKDRPLQVRVEGRVVEMDDRLRREFDEDALEAALASGDARWVAAGEVLGFDNQRVHCTIMDRTHPTPETIDTTGWVLDVTPVVGADRRTVTVDLRFEMVRPPGSADAPRELVRVETTVAAKSGRAFVAAAAGESAVLVLRATVVGLE